MSKKQLVSRLTEFANSSWASSKKITLSHNGVWDDYSCANPDGPVDNSDCPEVDPLCNCPCQELKPDSEEQLERINGEIHGVNEETGLAVVWTISPFDMKEPTEQEIKDTEESIKECELIETTEGIGSDYLGCLWDDIEHPSSCDCPCVGPKFSEYLDYTRTYSTYWDTPPQQQLWRNAQMNLISSQRASISISGDLTLRPGTMVFINVPVEGNDGTVTQKRYGGRWLVASITHRIGAYPVAHGMDLSLIRDTVPLNPDEKPSAWDDILSLIQSWIS